eukprot:9702889-Alexandrium_andersonii.AAC.1
MSASLVGSEMCIRDRRILLGAADRAGIHIAGRRRRVGRAQHRFRASATPVSYTHLTLPTICSV